MKLTKNKFKRTLSWVLTLALVLSLLPVMAIPASAAITTGLNFSSGSPGTSGDGWTWDSANKVLAINGLEINTADAKAILLPAGSTVDISGTNSITNTNNDGYGINGEGNLVFSGNGTLNITTSGLYTSPIYTNGNITVSGGIITATGIGSASDYDHVGVSANTFSMTGGEVTITNNASSGSSTTKALNALTISITGGTLTASTLCGSALSGSLNTSPEAYNWMHSTSANGSLPTTGEYPGSAYTWSSTHKYVKIETITTPSYKLVFKDGDSGWDLYEGTGYLNDVSGSTVYTGNADKWSVSGNKLTLKDGFNFITTNSTLMEYNADIIIEIENGATASLSNDGAPNNSNASFNGISTGSYDSDTQRYPSVTIQGDGELNVTLGEHGKGNNRGIFTQDLTVDGAELNIDVLCNEETGSDTNRGIACTSGSVLTIDGGALVTVSALEGNYGFGAGASSILLNNGTIDAAGKTNAFESMADNKITGSYTYKAAVDGGAFTGDWLDPAVTPLTWTDKHVALKSVDATRTKILDLTGATVEKEIGGTWQTNAVIDDADSTAEGWAWYPNGATEAQTGITDGVTGKVLLLKGLKLSADGTFSYGTTYAAAIALPGGTTVVIKEDSSAESTNTGNQCGAIVALGDLTITGDDSKTLTVTGGPNASNSYGIWVAGSGDLTMSGGTVKAASSNNTANTGNGIQVSVGNFIMTGGTVYATGNGTSASYGICVANGNFTSMTGGTIYADFKNGTSGNRASVKAGIMSPGTVPGNLVINKTGPDYTDTGSLTDADIKIVAGLTVIYDENTDDVNLTGDVPDDQGGVSGTTITVAGNTGKLARPGYIFDGWYTDEECMTAAGTSFELTADTTLYAKWTEIDFTVHYDKSTKKMYKNSVAPGNEITKDQLPNWDTADSGATLVLKDGFNVTSSAAVALQTSYDTTTINVTGNATAKSTNTSSAGGTAGTGFNIQCNTTATINVSSGVTLTAISSDTAETSTNRYGIAFMNNFITTGGGTIVATAGNAFTQSIGISASGTSYNGNTTASIGTGTVVATGGTADLRSCGVFLFGDSTLTMNGGTLKATGNKHGIQLDGSSTLEFTSGSITAKGGINAVSIEGNAPTGVVVMGSTDADGTYDIPAQFSGGYIKTTESGENVKYAIIGEGVTVTFDKNGASDTAPTATTVVSGSTVTLPGITDGENYFMTPPIGKYLSGWKVQSGDGTLLTVGADYTVNNDVTLVAQWEDIDFTLYFNKGDGELYIDEGLDEADKVSNVMLLTGYTTGDNNNTFVLNGFTFTTSANTALVMPADTKIKVTDDSAVTSTGFTCGIEGKGALEIEISDDKTLTATGTDSGIYVNGNFTMSGDGAIKASAASGGKAVVVSGTISDNAIVRGYNNSTSEYDISGKFAGTPKQTQNASTSALLEKAKLTLGYTVTYDGNGAISGAVVDLNDYALDGTETATVKGEGDLARGGLGFGGWNTEADGTGDAYEEGDTITVDGNITLYAQWIIDFTAYYSTTDGKLYKTFNAPDNYTDDVSDVIGNFTPTPGNTLTLNEGFNFITSAEDALVMPSGTTIHVNGDSTIKSTYEGTYISRGIQGEGALTINVADSMTLDVATADTTNNGDRYSIDITGAFTKTGSGTLNATAGNGGNSSYGIQTMGDFTLSAGILHVKSGSAGDSRAMYIDGDIAVNGGTLTAEADLTSGYSCGINATDGINGEFTMTGGRIFAKGATPIAISPELQSSVFVSGKGTANYTVEPTFVDAGEDIPYIDNVTEVRITPAVTRATALDFTVSELDYVNTHGYNAGGSPNAVSISDSIEGWEWQYDAENPVLVLDGLQLDLSSDNLFAIKVPANTTIVVISNSAIWGYDSESVNPTCAIDAVGNLIINIDEGVEFDAYAGGNDGGVSIGVYVSGDFTKQGKGSLWAAGGSGLQSNGISVMNDFAISAGTIYAYANDAEYPDAMRVGGTVPISGIVIKGYDEGEPGAYSVAAKFTSFEMLTFDVDTDYYAITESDGTTTVTDAKITVSSGSEPSPGGGGGGGGSVSKEPESPSAEVIVDGKPVDAGKVEVKDDTTTVIINQETFQKQLETASSNVIIVIPSETGRAVAEIVVKNVDDMAGKGMTLTVQVGNVQYELPTTAVDTESILTALGADNAADVPISITIATELGTSAQEAVSNAVVTSGGELVIPPIEFKITATYNGKTIEIDVFSQYVSRAIEVTAEQAAKVTTALVVDPDGTTRQVPTKVYQSGGKWYVEINSLTNSTYAVINNALTFTDAAGKWYKSAVNEMGSRMVISGVGDGLFAGDRDITRAEFAAIIVRALGLPANGNGAVFTDVTKSAWYCGAVGTAYEYGIVSGVGNNQFAPDKKITRQEAMLMIQRAAKIAGFAGSTGSISSFKDASAISSWALEAAKWNVGSGLIVGSDGEINPTDNITRAETATLVLKLMQKSELVDVRTNF